MNDSLYTGNVALAADTKLTIHATAYKDKYTTSSFRTHTTDTEAGQGSIQENQGAMDEGSGRDKEESKERGSDEGIQITFSVALSTFDAFSLPLGQACISSPFSKPHKKHHNTTVQHSSSHSSVSPTPGRGTGRKDRTAAAAATQEYSSSTVGSLT